MARQTPDTILHNGKILTVDADSSIQEAVAVRDSTIQAVGKSSDVLALAGAGTATIDLKGRTVIPGIVDAHAHMDAAMGRYRFESEELNNMYPSLEGARSIADIKALIKRHLGEKTPGEWLVTMPIGTGPYYLDAPDALAEKRFPTRWELDEVSPDNPVFIRGIFPTWKWQPSIAVANSRALELAGIDRHTTPPHSTITIERDGNGEPTGVLIDDNRFSILEFTLMKVVPRFTHAQRVAFLRGSMKLFNSVGMTGVYEGHGIAPEIFRVYKELWEAGEMTVRSWLTVSPIWKSVSEADRDLERWAFTASGGGFGDDMLRLAGYHIGLRRKAYIARYRSAALPYTGWAGFAETYNSLPRFRQLVRLAARHDLRVNTISFGSSFADPNDPLEEILDVFEEADREFGIADRRWVLVHLRHTTPERRRRIRRLGLVTTSIPLADLWLAGEAFLDDPARADSMIAHRRYIDEGIPFGIGTDNMPFSPFPTLWTVVSRKERTTGRVVGPSQRLTREEALRAFTMGGAYVCGDESRRGSLEAGKLADLAVLSADLLSVPEDDISELRSLLTMVGGKTVYQAEDF